MSEPFSWPDGIQAAAAITVNFGGESVEHGSMDLPLWGRYSHGRYGAQQGVDNLLELFDRYGVKATFFIAGWDAERYPRAMEAIASSGHEVAACGYLHEDFSKLSVEDQGAVLERSEAVLQKVFGRKPVGFRAPDRLLSRDTRSLLASRGYRYDSSYCDDDRPYVVELTDGQRLAELPIHEPWFDKPYYERHRTSRAFTESIVDEFDATYGVGGLFTLGLHPRGDYGSGRGLRVRALEPLLQAFQEHPRLWLTTCVEIADWTLDTIDTDRT
jgi:peptidoglycan/xylan/chitin deacetylase (PgdA/CDA1 family)